MAQHDPTEIEFIPFEDVCAIHDRGLEEFGEGAPGFVDEHVVRSAVGQALASVFGQYMHEFPAGMAAAYLYFLARQQGFVQGNKRAAVGAAIELLARNGYDLDVTSLELYECVKRAAGEDVKRDHKESLRELQEWIEEHLRPMP
jgi:death-on-curing family protein